MALTSTWTCEEGTDGAAVTTASSGAVAVSGSPVYAAAAAKHGSMGLNLTGASAVVFTEPTTGGAGNGQSSTYVNLITAGSSPVTAVAPKQASTFHARVRFNNSNGKIDVIDGSQTTVQGTSATSYVLGQWVRIDIRRTYSSPNMTITVRLFFGANIEGTVPDETLGPYTLNVGTNATARDSIGPPVAGAVLYADTHRMYDDTTTWPAPYAPAQTISPSAIASSEAFGTPTVSITGPAPQTLSPSAITSGEAFGAASVSVGRVTISPSSIASSEAFGTPTINRGPVSVSPSAIASSEAFGTPTISGGSITAQLAVDFEDGTVGAFAAEGATVGATGALDGTKGARLAPNGSGFASLVWNIASGQQIHSWWALRMLWRPVVKTSETGNFGSNVLFEVFNTLTSGLKGQFTMYTQGGNLGVDFNTTDFSSILAAYTTGQKHLIEVRCFYGATTYTAYVRIDNVEFVHTSANTQTAAFVRALSIKYAGNVTDDTNDVDDIQFWYGDADPGYLPALSTQFQLLTPSAIASSEVFGTPMISAGTPPAQTVSPSGIASAQALGTPTISQTTPGQTVSPSAITSGEAFGTATVSAGTPPAQTVTTTSIPSAESFGSPSLTTGAAPAQTITPVGIVSGEAFGVVRIIAAGTPGGGTVLTLPCATTARSTPDLPHAAGLSAKAYHSCILPQLHRSVAGSSHSCLCGAHY